MRPNHLPILLLLPSLLLSSCVVQLGGCGSTNVRGSGLRIAEERQVEHFDRVSISGGFRARIRSGEPHSVVIRGDDNVLEHVRTRLREGRLEVSLQNNVRLRTDEPIELEIALPSLRALAISGSCELDLDGVDTQRFELSVSGSATGRAAGRVEELAISVSGSARQDLFDLVAQEVDIRISGSARLDVHAERRLDVQVSGSGAIRYRGQPDVQSRISGSGSVRSAGE